MKGRLKYMKSKEPLKTLKWMLISFILAVIICLFSFLGYLNILLKMSHSEQKMNEGYVVYSIQQESNPLEISLESFQKLHNELSQNSTFEYFEIYKQYLEMPNQKGEFFEEGTEQLLNQCEGIKCVQISENVVAQCAIDISAGRLFEKKDFMYKNSEAIPVLMGHAYSSLYHIGDIFEAEYLFNQYEFSIIGFLSEESSINMASYNINLDKSILMPSFAIDSNVPITDGLKIHYANKTSGLVRLNTIDANVFYENIEPLLKNANTGAYTWTITPFEYQYKEMFKISINQTKILIIILMILLTIGDICLIYNFSKYGFKRKTIILKEQLLYGLFTTVLTSIFYIVINIILIFLLGIKIISYYHFIFIGLLSCCMVLLNYILIKYKVGKA